MKNKNHLQNQVCEFIKKYAWKNQNGIHIYVNRHNRPPEQCKEIQYLIKHEMVKRKRIKLYFSNSGYTYFELNSKGLAFIAKSGVYDIKFQINKY